MQHITPEHLDVVINPKMNDDEGTIRSLCDQGERLFTEIWANCGGVTSTIDCPCCTVCVHYDRPDGEATLVNDFQARCQINENRYEIEGGPYHEPNRGTQCDCSADGSYLRCTDTSCLTCNRAGTICFRNTEYGFQYNTFAGRGEPSGWYGIFEYVEPPPSIGSSARPSAADRGVVGTVVRFEYASLYEACEVTVNNERCRSCGLGLCRDGDITFIVDCTNIQQGTGLGSVNACDENNHVGGYMTVFEIADPLLQLSSPTGETCSAAYNLQFFDIFTSLV